MKDDPRVVAAIMRRERRTWAEPSRLREREPVAAPMQEVARPVMAEETGGVSVKSEKTREWWRKNYPTEEKRSQEMARRQAKRIKDPVVLRRRIKRLKAQLRVAEAEFREIGG